MFPRSRVHEINQASSRWSLNLPLCPLGEIFGKKAFGSCWWLVGEGRSAGLAPGRGLSSGWPDTARRATFGRPFGDHHRVLEGVLPCLPGWRWGDGWPPHDPHDSTRLRTRWICRVPRHERSSLEDGLVAQRWPRGTKTSLKLFREPSRKDVREIWLGDEARTGTGSPVRPPGRRAHRRARSFPPRAIVRRRVDW